MVMLAIIGVLKAFFAKPAIGVGIAYLLLYRFPEAQLLKLAMPFLLDPPEAGGLGLSTRDVGLAYGTVGLTALTLGGIAGGLLVARGAAGVCGVLSVGDGRGGAILHRHLPDPGAGGLWAPRLSVAPRRPRAACDTSTPSPCSPTAPPPRSPHRGWPGSPPDCACGPASTRPRRRAPFGCRPRPVAARRWPWPVGCMGAVPILLGTGLMRAMPIRSQYSITCAAARPMGLAGGRWAPISTSAIVSPRGGPVPLDFR